MDSFSTPLQVYEGSEYDSPKSMRVSRRSSQISDNSSGLSLNFHKYSIENSEESLHSNSFHGGLHRHFSLSQLSHGEPLTMDPPDDLRSVKHENDKYNVLNPIPVFTDLLGSERYTHAEGSGTSAMPENFIDIPIDTEIANVASLTNSLTNGIKHTSQLNPSGLQHKTASPKVRKPKGCHVVKDNVYEEAPGVVYTSFQNLLEATPAGKSNDISVPKSGRQPDIVGQYDMEYEHPQVQTIGLEKTTASKTSSTDADPIIESTCTSIDPEVVICSGNHIEEELRLVKTQTSSSSRTQPLIEQDDQQTLTYSYTEFPKYIPDLHDSTAKHIDVGDGDPPSGDDKTPAPSLDLNGTGYIWHLVAGKIEDSEAALIPCCHRFYYRNLLTMKGVFWIVSLFILLPACLTLLAPWSFKSSETALRFLRLMIVFLIPSIFGIVYLTVSMSSIMKTRLRCSRTKKGACNRLRSIFCCGVQVFHLMLLTGIAIITLYLLASTNDGQLNVTAELTTSNVTHHFSPSSNSSLAEQRTLFHWVDPEQNTTVH